MRKHCNTVLYTGTPILYHMYICACVIVQFAQKHNLLGLFTITSRTYTYINYVVVFIVQTKAEVLHAQHRYRNIFYVFACACKIDDMNCPCKPQERTRV